MRRARQAQGSPLNSTLRALMLSRCAYDTHGAAFSQIYETLERAWTLENFIRSYKVKHEQGSIVRYAPRQTQPSSPSYRTWTKMRTQSMSPRATSGPACAEWTRPRATAAPLFYRAGASKLCRLEKR